MTVLNTNIPSLVAHKAMTMNARSMSQAMERLSTGKRINSGADDPAGVAVAARLQAAARADRQGVKRYGCHIHASNIWSGGLKYSRHGNSHERASSPGLIGHTYG